MPRNAIGAKGIQVYGPGGVTWSKKALIMRNAPYTIENPTLGQIQTRLNFGDHAKAAAGCRGLVDGLPCVAAALRNALKGYRAANSKPPSEWESRTKPSFHTMDELRTMLEEKSRVAGRQMTALARI